MSNIVERNAQLILNIMLDTCWVQEMNFSIDIGRRSKKTSNVEKLRRYKRLLTLTLRGNRLRNFKLENRQQDRSRSSLRRRNSKERDLFRLRNFRREYISYVIFKRSNNNKKDIDVKKSKFVEICLYLNTFV